MERRKWSLTASVLERFSRQLALKELGKAGQRRLSRGTVLVVGCGGLGCSSSGLLVRAGVGRLVLVDGGLLEPSNLHRQVLYDEDDLGRPKAMAAADHLNAIDPTAEVISIAEDVNGANIGGLLVGVDVLVDGTDSLVMRHLLNDACIKHGVPWVYGGASRMTGMCMTIVPGRTPCLSCAFPGISKGPAQRSGPLPVLNTLPSIIGAIQATEAIKLILGKAPRPGLLVIDAWDWEARVVKVKVRKDCPTCQHRHFPCIRP